jgi:hypothetical protein
MVTPLLRSKSAPGGAVSVPRYLARRTGAEILLPAAGAPITVTSGVGAAWTFGAWTLIGTPANDFYLSHAHVAYVETLAAIQSLLLELSRTAAHTPVDATRYPMGVSDPTGDSVAYFPLDYTARPQLIPAGQAVYGRSAIQGGLARDFRTLLVGWDTAMPVWTALASGIVTGPGRYYPSNTAGQITVACGGAWVPGNSVTVVDPAPNDMLVTDVILLASAGMGALSAAAVQVGYGPNLGETWCATVPLGNVCSPWYIHPPVLIRAGERLAMRGARNVAGNVFVLVKVYDM